MTARRNSFTASTNHSASYSTRADTLSAYEGEAVDKEAGPAAQNATFKRPLFLKLLESIRLQTAVMMLLLVLVPILVVCFMWLLLLNPIAATLVKTTRDSSYRNLHNRMKEGIDNNIVAMRAAIAAVQQGKISLDNFNETKPFVWELWRGRSSDSPLLERGFSGIYAGLEDGSILGYFLEIDGHVYFAQHWGAINPNNLLLWRIVDHNTGATESQPTDVPDYPLDYSKGPWYYSARENALQRPDFPKYSNSYVDTRYPGLLFISLSTPILKDDKFHAYLTMDSTTGKISDALHMLSKSMEGSIAYIVEKNTGYLIATSKEVHVFIEKSDGEVFRYRAEDYDDKSIREIHGHLTELLGDGLSKLSDDTADFDKGESYWTEKGAQGTHYLINLGLIRRYGLEWVIVLAVPQWNYTNGIVLTMMFAAILSVIIASVSMIIGLIYSLLGLHPFMQFRNQLASVQDMQLDDLNLKSSFFSEVRILQYYFFNLVERLRVYRSFLPQRLLDTLDGQINDEEGIKNVEGADGEVAAGTESKDNAKKDKSTEDELSHASVASRTSRNSGHTRHSSMRESTFDALNFAIGLEHRRVTLLLFRLENFSAMLESTIFFPEEIVELHSDLLDIIQRIARSHKGEVASIGGDECTIVWTYSDSKASTQSNKRAVSAANQIIEQIRALNHQRQMAHNNMYPRRSQSITILHEAEELGAFDSAIQANVTVSIVSGSAYMGNLGTKTSRQYTVDGPGLKHVHHIARLQRLYKTLIAIDSSVKQDVAQSFVVRPLIDPGPAVKDVEQLKDLDPVHGALVQEQISSLHQSKGSVFAFELGPEKKVNMDEWMYELEQQSALSQWESYTNAMTELAEFGRIEKAQEMLQEYKQSNPQDQVAQVTLDIIAAALSSTLK